MGPDHGDHDHGAEQAGHGVRDEEPAQADPGDPGGEQPHRSAGPGEGGRQEPEGDRARVLVGEVGDEGLARGFVELEGETEQDDADDRTDEGGAGGDDDLGRGAPDESEADGGDAAETVGEDATGESRGDGGGPEERQQGPGRRDGQAELLREDDSEERQGEGADAVDRSGGDEGPHGGRQVAWPPRGGGHDWRVTVIMDFVSHHPDDAR